MPKSVVRFLCILAVMPQMEARATPAAIRSELIHQVKALEKILPVIEETEKLKGLIEQLELDTPPQDDHDDLTALSRAINAHQHGQRGIYDQLMDDYDLTEYPYSDYDYPLEGQVPGVRLDPLDPRLAM
ncbi:uncharacterized protein LOC131885406 [Tigriopus californicus]|nr:uncharacterized protein LOC131885406 [Tigriopus californicus]